MLNNQNTNSSNVMWIQIRCFCNYFFNLLRESYLVFAVINDYCLEKQYVAGRQSIFDSLFSTFYALCQIGPSQKHF